MTLRQKLRVRFDRFFFRRRPELERVGPVCSWVILPPLVEKGGVVVSGGVGQDIGFEKELVRRFDCTVHLFDPTPTGATTMQLPENQVRGVQYERAGLAGTAGMYDFAFPRDPAEGSFSVAQSYTQEKLRLKCDSVVNFLRTKNVASCNLLKLDIEGFEYGVIDEILDARMEIAQICVEYHHFLPGIPLHRTARQILRLISAGYRIAHKSQCDYLFVHRRHLSRL